MRTNCGCLIFFCLLVITPYTYGISNCHEKCSCHPKVMTCSGLNQDEFNSDTFQNSITASLERIHINDGSISSLPINIFGKCKGDSDYVLDKLVKLDLHNNKIHEIRGKTFHCMPNLEELNLANNQWNISTIHTRIFTSISNLKKLNLSNSFHDDVDGDFHLMHLQTVFMESNLTKLEVLSLDDNRFGVFDAGSANAICTFPALKRLNLANNILPKIRLYHMRCSPHLEYLDLSYNDINTFEDYSHNGLLYSLDFIQTGSPNLTVNFVGNEFDCDCGLLEFRNWLKRTKVHVIKKTQLKCHDGLRFNHSITSLESNEFKCFSVNPSTSSSKAVVGVLVTMFVLIALFLIVIVYIKRESVSRFVSSFKKPSLAREHLFGYSSVNNENAADIEV